MRLDEWKRKEFWEAYKDLNIKVQNLKEIIQNDIELSEDMLQEHSRETDIIIHKLGVLDRELWDYALRSKNI